MSTIVNGYTMVAANDAAKTFSSPFYPTMRSAQFYRKWTMDMNKNEGVDFNIVTATAVKNPFLPRFKAAVAENNKTNESVGIFGVVSALFLLGAVIFFLCTGHIADGLKAVSIPLSFFLFAFFGGAGTCMKDKYTLIESPRVNLFKESVSA